MNTINKISKSPLLEQRNAMKTVASSEFRKALKSTVEQINNNTLTTVFSDSLVNQFAHLHSDMYLHLRKLGKRLLFSW